MTSKVEAQSSHSIVLLCPQLHFPVPFHLSQQIESTIPSTWISCVTMTQYAAMSQVVKKMAEAIRRGTGATLQPQMHTLLMLWREELQQGKQHGHHQLVELRTKQSHACHRAGDIGYVCNHGTQLTEKTLDVTTLGSQTKVEPRIDITLLEGSREKLGQAWAKWFHGNKDGNRSGQGWVGQGQAQT
uniref:Uncharacterized protein n=1 Tax=Oryza brachyantha TaxID=4533 RepID=J3MEH6_ORYBR